MILVLTVLDAERNQAARDQAAETHGASHNIGACACLWLDFREYDLLAEMAWRLLRGFSKDGLHDYRLKLLLLLKLWVGIVHLVALVRWRGAHILLPNIWIVHHGCGTSPSALKILSFQVLYFFFSNLSPMFQIIKAALLTNIYIFVYQFML